MKVPAVPGIGDFSVTARGNCSIVCVNRSKRTLLHQQWMPELHAHIKRKLRGQALVIHQEVELGGKVQIFKLAPTSHRLRGYKHKGCLGALQHATMRAIKAFIKGLRRRAGHNKHGHERHEQRLSVRRPMPLRRQVVLPAR